MSTTPQTTPLAKAIHTLEGQLVIISNLIVGVLAAIPAHVLSPKTAALVVGIQNVALILQRGVIKAQASKGLNTLADAPNFAAALAEVEQLAGVQDVFQSQPGTPEHLVTAGLSPSVEEQHPQSRTASSKPKAG